MNSAVFRPCFQAVGLLLLAGVLTAKAATGTDTWIGGGANALWSNAANWSGVNTPPATGDTPTFGASYGAGGATLNNDLTAGTSFAGLTFNTAAPSFVLNGNSIASSAGITDNSPNLETINLNLAFSATHSLTTAAGSSLLIGGVISGAGGVTKAGAGTVTLTNDNTYTGTTTVSAGTLALDFNAASAANNIVAATSALSLGGGGLYINGNSSAASSQTFASTALSGANNISINAPNSVTLTLGAITQTSVGTTLAILPSGVGTTTVVGSAGSNVNAPAATPINSLTAGYVSGCFVTYGTSDYAMISSGNVVALGSANYTANAGPNADVGSTGYTTPSTTTSINCMRFNTAGTASVVNRTVYTTGGILVTPAYGVNNATITSSGTLHSLEPNRSSTSGSEAVIWQNDTSGYLIFAGANTLDNGKTGNAAWVQAGPGTVQYNQNVGTANGFGASMYLNGGYTLVSANGNAVFGAQATAATLNLNGGTVVAGASFTMDNAGLNPRPISLANAGGGLAAATSQTLTVDGVISGAGSLTIGTGTLPGSGAGTANTTAVIGNGTVTLSGADIYTGNTIINAGTLALGSTGSINNSPNILVSTGTTFDVSAVSGFALAANQTLAGTGTINGSVNTSAGSIIYGGTDGTYGTNTFNNNLTFASGALCYLDLGTVYNQTNDLISVGGTLTLNNTVFHLKAPVAAVNLDTSADYVLISAAGISGSPASTPVWDVQPANAANFIIKQSGNSIVLHYSTSAPPSGTGTATPASVNRNQTTTLTVVATAGSSPIASIVVDASAIGGSSSLTLVQSNSTSVYTNSVTVGSSIAPGGYALTATLTDSSTPTPLTGQANISLTVLNSQTWSGLGSDANWSTSANWASGVAPVSGDFLTFAGTTDLTPNMDSSASVTGIAFGSNAGSFTLGSSGGTVTLTSLGITNNSGNPQTVNMPVSVGAAETFNSASGNLILNQNVNNNGHAISFDGSHSNIVSGTLSGTGAVFKNGAGSLVLTNANGYTGGTTINAGTIVVSNSYALGFGTMTRSAGSVQLADGVIVTNAWAQASTDTSDSQLDVPSVGAIGTWTGPVNCPNSDQFRAAGTGGTLVFSNSPIACGSSIFVVSRGSVNFAGNTTVSAGSGLLERPNATGVNSSITLKDNAALNFTTSASLGGGKASGTLALTMQDNAALTCGTTFDVDGSTTAGAVSTVNLNGGTITVAGIAMSLSSGVATLNLNGGVIKASASSSTFFPSFSGLTAAVGAGGAKINDNGFIITVAEPLTHASGLGSTPDGGLTKLGAGTNILTASSTYTGNTTISAGTLALTGSASIASSANINIAAGAALDVSGLSSTFNLGAAQTLSAGASGTGNLYGNFNLAAGSLALAYTSGTPSLQVTNGTLTFNGNAVTVNVAGSPLAAGSYLLVATGTAGQVSGTLPASVTVTGAGLAPNTVPVLKLISSQLYLIVDQPLASTMTVTRTAGLNLIVSLADLATNFSDPAGLPVTLTGVNLVTTNGVNLTTNSSWIFYTNSPDVNDQISYSIANSAGATNIGYINIVVVTAPAGTNSIAGITMGNPNIVHAFGIPGYNYALERATNLAPAVWVDVSTNTAASNGAVDAMDSFTDLGGTPPVSAYYRLKWLP